MPTIIATTDVHAGILIALVLAVVTYIVLEHTPAGFQVRMLGANLSAAAYAGVNVGQTVIIAMVVSGGLAGLGGASEVMGLKHRLFDASSPGYGYDAIVVAFLGAGQPLGVVTTAFFFGALRSGANIMQRSQGVPVAVIFAIQGLAALFLAVRHRIFRWGGRSRQLVAASQAASRDRARPGSNSFYGTGQVNALNAVTHVP